MRWRAPVWTHTIGTTVVLHDAPLWRDGEFVGMLGQIVPIAELSAELVRLTADTDFIPFVLYDRDQVLAHPLLMSWNPTVSYDAPLLEIDELGDSILEEIWSPDDVDLYFLRDLVNSQASASRLDDTWYAYLYRDISAYGPRPWTIGVYLNTRRHDEPVMKSLALAALAGLVVLCLSVLAAVLVVVPMGVLHFPDLQDADTVFLKVMQQEFPPVLRGLAVAAGRRLTTRTDQLRSERAVSSGSSR